jgi:hypothetical protein
MKRLLQAITAVGLGLAFATGTFAQVMPESVPVPAIPPVPVIPDETPAPTIPLPSPGQITKDTGKLQAPKSEKKPKRKKHKRFRKPIQP